MGWPGRGPVLVPALPGDPDKAPPSLGLSGFRCSMGSLPPTGRAKRQLDRPHFGSGWRWANTGHSPCRGPGPEPGPQAGCARGRRGALHPPVQRKPVHSLPRAPPRTGGHAAVLRPLEPRSALRRRAGSAFGRRPAPAAGVREHPAPAVSAPGGPPQERCMLGRLAKCRTFQKRPWCSRHACRRASRPQPPRRATWGHRGGRPVSSPGALSCLSLSLLPGQPRPTTVGLVPVLRNLIANVLGGAGEGGC